MRLPRLVSARASRGPSDGNGAKPDLSPGPSESSRAANHIIAARNEFANAFGDLARGKRNWQMMAFALVGLLAMVTLAYVRLAASSRVVPYVVEVDRLGQVVAVGTADQMRAPDQRLVASQLAQFLRAIRTVLPAAASAGQAEMVRRGYSFVAPEAAAFLNDYFASPVNDPRVLGTRLTRQVDVTGVLRVPNSDVWRLQWTETERSTQPGGPVRTTAWEGYVTIRLAPPTTAESIQDNPLGLYVTSVNWTQVGEGTPAWPGSRAPGGNDSDSLAGGAP
jgi:type IV secretion system protein VirB5